jgi:hypothetical protein
MIIKNPEEVGSPKGRNLHSDTSKSFARFSEKIPCALRREKEKGTIFKMHRKLLVLLNNFCT